MWVVEPAEERTSIHDKTFSTGCHIWSPSSANRSTTALVCEESFLITRAAQKHPRQTLCPPEQLLAYFVHLLMS